MNTPSQARGEQFHEEAFYPICLDPHNAQKRLVKAASGAAISCACDPSDAFFSTSTRGLGHPHSSGMIGPVTCTGNQMRKPQTDPHEGGVSRRRSTLLIGTRCNYGVTGLGHATPHRRTRVPHNLHSLQWFPMGRTIAQETNGPLLEYGP